MASPEVVEGVTAAVGALPRLLPRRMARLPPQTPRAPEEEEEEEEDEPCWEELQPQGVQGWWLLLG